MIELLRCNSYSLITRSYIMDKSVGLHLGFRNSLHLTRVCPTQSTLRAVASHAEGRKHNISIYSQTFVYVCPETNQCYIIFTAAYLFIDTKTVIYYILPLL